jgi:hypothetical protein
MNIIELQEELEYWPDQKIHEEVMRPTGAANGQTYLVVLEAERRNKERQAYQAALATQQQPQPTVVQETMMEFGGGQPMGGVPDVDPNMMQNQMMAQQMPQQQMPQQMPQGQPMAMKAGGAIRYQGGEYIDPSLYGIEGIETDEDDLTWIGEEGLLFDTDLYGLSDRAGTSDDPYYGRPGSRAAWIAADLLKLKAAATAAKLAKKGWKKRGKISEGLGAFKRKVRERLGGTGPRTASQAPNPANPSGVPMGPKTVQAPTTRTGKAVDYAIDHPYTTIGGTGLVTGVATSGGSPVVSETTEAEEIGLSEADQKELDKYHLDSVLNLTHMGISQNDLSKIKKSEKESQLAYFRTVDAEGNMPNKSKLGPSSTLNAGATSSNTATSRPEIMDQLSNLLGAGDQAIRDQQSAALIQLGAGIAGGDIAGGLSAAGKEVSALKSARSSEKLKAIMALIEMEYKQGLLSASQADAIIAEIELLQEDYKLDENVKDQRMNRLLQELQLLRGNRASGISNTSNISNLWS